MNVAIYVRVSTEEQAKEGHSIEAQKDKLKKYCDLFEYKVFNYYVDEGISGKSMDRPNLQRLISDAEERKFDMVLVWKISRLSRSLRDLLNIVYAFELNDIAFASYSEKFDTSHPVGKMTLQLLGSIAEFDRNTIAENVKLALRHKQRKGQVHGGSIFGYDNIDKKLIVNVEESEIVKMIFNLFIEGYSMISIACKLNDMGITTRRGKRWTTGSLYVILKNQTYLGKIRKKLKKGQLELLPGIHDLIIDEKTFNKVQKIFKKRSHGRAKYIYR